MIRLSAIVALVVGMLALLLGGCGGSGDLQKTSSPFAGSYIGTFNSSDGETGTTRVSVDDSGNATGTIHNNSFNLDGTVAGTISGTGATNLTYSYGAAGSATGTGTLSFTSASTVSGTLALSSGTTSLGTSTLTLTRQ